MANKLKIIHQSYRAYTQLNRISSTKRYFCSLDIDSSLIITKACARRIKFLQDKSNNVNLKLRLSVEGGGCSGFQYVFNMEESVIDEEDRVFKKDEAEVVIDRGSFELVKGSTIDYVQEMIKSAFAVLNNPQSESACGCGSSFAVKNFSANPAVD
eukprot:gene12576-16864_t